MHQSSGRDDDSSLEGKSILFYSVSYRPEHAGIGPYAAAVADRLSAEGAEVNVIAGLPHYPSWRVADEDRWRLRRSEVNGGVRVKRLRQFVPRKQSAVSRSLYELSFLVHGLITRPGGRSPDLVIAVSPALAGAMLGRIAAARHRVPFVVIIQDFVSAGARQSGMTGGSLVGALLEKVEPRLFRRAQAVGVVHDSFVNRCLRMGIRPERLQVVPNWSLREVTDEVPNAKRPLEWEGRFVVLHAGNMGFKQGLEVVVEAARMAQEAEELDVLFVLMGDGNRRDRLSAMVEGLSTIAIIDPVSDEEFQAVLAAADALLVAQRHEVHDMSVPSKLTAYFSAGRAVISSVATDSGTASEVRRSGGGIVVPAQDAEALLEAVLKLQNSPGRARALGEAGHSYAVNHLSARPALDRVVSLVKCGLRQFKSSSR